MLHRNAAQTAEDGPADDKRPADLDARRWNAAPTQNLVLIGCAIRCVRPAWAC